MFFPVICWLLFFVLSSVIPEAAYALADLRQDVFIKEDFRHLNVPRVRTFTVYDVFDCTFECLSNPSCFSLNLAAFKGADRKLWCELLSSDKNSNPEEYKGNKSSHHFFIKGRDASPNKSKKKAEFRPTSCLDYLRRYDTTSGIYKLYDNSGNSFSAYCDLKSEPGIAWTLVMSWSLKNRRLTAFWDKPITYNWPLNENAQNWNQYRLSQNRMKSLQAHSTHWRATCCYPTHGVDFTDYVRGNFKDFNIIDYLANGQCKKVEYIDVRGHKGTNLTVPFFQVDNTFILHINSPSTYCQFNASPGSVSSEDNFGFYGNFNPNFRCTQESISTTQWWFGAHL